MNEFENDNDEFDIEAFREAIGPHWMYHQLCNSMNWAVLSRDDLVTHIEIAPPLQSIYSGPDCGKIVWSPFEFDVFAFLGEAGIDDIEKVGVVTFSEQDGHCPFIGIIASFRGKPFSLRIHLEPQPETEPREIVDRIRNEVRAIEEEAF